jgi:hypothetical protein
MGQNLTKPVRTDRLLDAEKSPVWTIEILGFWWCVAQSLPRPRRWSLRRLDRFLALVLPLQTKGRGRHWKKEGHVRHPSQ